MVDGGGGNEAMRVPDELPSPQQIARQFLAAECPPAEVRRLMETDPAFDEALWKKIAGFSDRRIIRIASSDNFWQMGDTGPCGPCSEIFYDLGIEAAEEPGVDKPFPLDEQRDVEIWNLVFMQYFQDLDGTRTPLPRTFEASYAIRSVTLRSSAARTMAEARGCEDPRSTGDAIASTSSSVRPATA